jgi:ferredoxin-NADP reductase
VLLTLPISSVVPAGPRARIVRLDLEGQSFPYRAGQAVLIASHGAEKRKPYSIAGAPEDAMSDGSLELLIGVNDTGQPGLHLQVTPGALVDLEGPVGHFTFPDAPVERRFLFVAGGTGIAPLRAMYRHSVAQGYGDVSVLYSARSPDDFAYAAELQELAGQGRIDLRMTVTREADQAWTGQRGRIGRDLLRPLLHGPETLCFICGPRALVDDMPKLLADLGVSRDRIRIEEW